MNIIPLPTHGASASEPHAMVRRAAKCTGQGRRSTADIPPSQAGWDVIGVFALTFDGYRHWGSFEACAEVANARRGSSLTELRTCLFFEQRRWRYFGDELDAGAMAYIWDLVESIRARVASRAID